MSIASARRGSRTRVEQVTPERVASTDHYRLQVNADKLLVAAGYNLLTQLMSTAEVAVIRNQQAEAINNLLRHQLRLLFASPDPVTRRLVAEFLKSNVAPELQGAVRALWRSLGWSDGR